MCRIQFFNGGHSQLLSRPQWRKGSVCQRSHHWGNAIQPEHTVVNEFNGDASRKAIKWKHIDNAARPFLDGTDVSLNFRHMFVGSDRIQCNAKTCKVAIKTILIELSIHHEMGDSKSAFGICLTNVLDCLENCFGFVICEKLGCTEFDML